MKGIDVLIERQKAIYAAMWTDYTTVEYGRIFRNERDGKTTPEALSGTEYKNVEFDDTLDGILFFDVLPRRSVNLGSHIADVHIYFAVKLDKLYPSVTERATEYLINDVLLNTFDFKVNAIITGKEAFDTWGSKPEDNMQPFFLLRIETSVKYKMTC
jgi:hypothetical protein